MRGFADEVARRWGDPDAGIGEVRGDAAHHVHSKLMAWLTLDRACASPPPIAPPLGSERGGRERSALGSDVTTRGYNERVGSYTRTYDSAELDAAVLVLPLVGLEPPDSPRVGATIQAIWQGLSAGGALLYRYPPGHDGLPGKEGAFVLAGPGAGRERSAGQGDRPVRPAGRLDKSTRPSPRRNGGRDLQLSWQLPPALTHAALI